MKIEFDMAFICWPSSNILACGRCCCCKPKWIGPQASLIFAVLWLFFSWGIFPMALVRFNVFVLFFSNTLVVSDVQGRETYLQKNYDICAFFRVHMRFPPFSNYSILYYLWRPDHNPHLVFFHRSFSIGNKYLHPFGIFFRTNVRCRLCAQHWQTFIFAPISIIHVFDIFNASLSSLMHCLSDITRSFSAEKKTPRISADLFSVFTSFTTRFFS